MYQNIFIASRTEEQPSTVYLWDDEKGLIVLPWDKFNYAYRKDATGQFTSIYGSRLKKVYTYTNEMMDVFESDVPRETRVLTDLYLDSDNPSQGHNVCITDIEVSSVGGFPSIEKADKEIYSICMKNKTTGEEVMFLLDKDGRWTDGMKDGLAVLGFRTEEELLRACLAWYTEQKFTIITGWNVAGFDIPYLYRRICNILTDDDANMLSPIGLIKWNKYRERYIIAGVSCLDYIELYKKYRFEPRPTYRLDYIGTVEGVGGKIEYDLTLDDLYEQDLPRFIDYNRQDVNIVYGLDVKFQYIELARSICHMGHVPYEDYIYSSKFIEGTIITYLHRKDIICPNKPVGGQEMMNHRDEVGGEGFAGAYVKEPIPGLYEWVYSLDLQSLYPSIIMSLNISPETKVGKVLQWDVDKHMRKEIEEYEVEVNDDRYTFSRDKFIEFMEHMELALSSNGILYMTNKLGVIPEILDKWFEQRKEYRKLMVKYAQSGEKDKEAYYDRRQHVQKIFLNSIYGVLGLPIFRFYDLDNALAVTATGQDVIKTSAKFLNGHYNKELKENKDHCIYIDTDSLYFSAEPLFGKYYGVWDTTVTQEAINTQKTTFVAQTAEEDLNTMYDKMGKSLFFINKHRFRIKGEKIARTGLWVAKKRYALWTVYDLEKGMAKEKLVVKGLDVVRSSFPPAFAEFMKSTLNDILRLKSKDEIDRAIIDFLDNLNKRDYIEIARNTSIKDGIRKYDDPKQTSLLLYKSGTPLHVKSAIAYNRFLKQKNLHRKHSMIRDGDKIKYVYLKQNPLGVDAIAFKGYDDPKELLLLIKQYIDGHKLFENELQGKLEDFYKALGWGKLPTKTNLMANEFFTF